MNVRNLLLQVPNPQIPHSNLPILPSTNTNLIIPKGNILHTIMSLQHHHGPNIIRAQNTSQLPPITICLQIKQLEFVATCTNQAGEGGGETQGVVVVGGRVGLQGYVRGVDEVVAGGWVRGGLLVFVG